MFNTAIGVLTLGAVLYITRRIISMSAQLDRLATEVSENTTVVNSAITLINGLAQQIRDNATDPAALTALADQLDAQSNALSEAVAANTPAT